MEYDSALLKEVVFDVQGLVPAILQDANTGQILMMAYMNRESLVKTLETGEAWFYSRSRKELWHKGETSGDFQQVVEISLDCDGDTLLLKVIPAGGKACHTGETSCFHRKLAGKAGGDVGRKGEGYGILDELYRVILDRKVHPKEGSYTCYLWEKGQDKILKKVGEETAEVIIGSKNNSKDEVIYEAADLLYHLLVLLAWHQIDPHELMAELAKRR
ncbi:MAG TPA: bifunctional phosphoribosyl-AMP cyclohydrolase/phosphoribosyl-ATP diphosphatase HisIE [Bacillota bacterium]